MESPIVTLPPSARSELTSKTIKNIESKQIQELYLLDPAANKVISHQLKLYLPKSIMFFFF